jgi:CRP/FNR family transcriptional regulator, nitrogen oxide reductase regulator
MPVSLRPDRSVLADVPLFAGLDAAAHDDVLAAAETKWVQKGTAVFEQGEPAEAFYVLLDGHLKAVQSTAAGQQLVVHLVIPSDFFGCVALMGRPYYPATALATKDSVVLSWNVKAVHRLLRRHRLIVTNALAGFGDRMMETQSRLREMHTERVARRIAHALLHLIRHSGRKVEGGIEIDFPVTRQDIAEMAGATLHTVSRTLSGWEKRGILLGGRQKIVVTDPHGLVAIAEEIEDS